MSEKLSYKKLKKKVKKLKKSGLSARQGLFASVLESNLDEIASSFSYKLSSRYYWVF